MGLDRILESSGAVSSSSSSSQIDCGVENVVFCGRESNGDANLVVDEWEHDQPIMQSMNLHVCEVDGCPSPSKGHREECKTVELVNKKIGHWWKQMISKRREIISRCECEAEREYPKKFETSRIKVQANKKRFKELSALFATQEIRAHKGIIWTMKFSTDGQYLATGGEDGVVRVWRVKSVDSCLERFPDESGPLKEGKTGFGREKKVKVPAVIPDKMFQIEKLSVQEFHGHAGDVLELAWSASNRLLSSSMDRTVRMWSIGSSKCLHTFHHTDYVTCVQFNPIDHGCFISGSIDGKVRIWGVSSERVIDWADIGVAVTAICYQPDGQGFVVGSLRGTCLFYEAKGDLVELSAQILVCKKPSTKRITGIQFFPDDSQRVMVMSEDSKIQILDKTDVFCKYRGLPKSGSQMSASFTSNRTYNLGWRGFSCLYLEP